MYHFEGEIGAMRRSRDDFRIAEPEKANDVFAHVLGGSRRESHDRRRSELA
jgi:hypothetical protein